ncbi:MAG: HEAT repeat domain-containing protein [Candidatus Riflebacteria bacterium]|nr:HEAT repeat domain-containing protein [Candidatus Riflebacteria bacterium]
MSEEKKILHSTDALKANLSSRDRGEKLLAIRAMSILRKPEYADSLVDVLSSPDAEVIDSTISALGQIQNPNSLKYLIPFLFDDNTERSETAWNAISKFNLKPVIPSILKAATSDKPPATRKMLLSLLAKVNDMRVASAMNEVLGQTRDIPLLCEALEYFIRFPAVDKASVFKVLSASEQWEVAMYADLALSRTGDDSARPRLKKLAKSPAYQMRLALAKGMNITAMVQDREIYEILIRDTHPPVRIAAFQGFSVFSASERQPLILELLEKEKDEKIRHRLYEIASIEKSPIFFQEFIKLLSSQSLKLKNLAQKALILMGKSIVSQIVAAFSSMPLEMKERVLLILGEIGCEKGLHLLISGLSSKERWLRINSIDGIARIKEKKFAVRFAEMASTESDPWILATLMSALVKIGSEKELEIAKNFLGHPDGRVRANAVAAVSKIDSPEVPKLLEPLVNDGNDRVRVNASVALWKIGEVKVLDRIVHTLKDSSKWRRSSAAYALGEIGDREPVPALLEMLVDKEDVVYRNTIEALGKIKDPRSVIPLLIEREKKRVPQDVIDSVLKSFNDN